LECDPHFYRQPELFNFVFDNPKVSDIALVAENQSLCANKIILSSLSSYFHKIFVEQSFNEKELVFNMPFNMLYTMIYYMYTEILRLDLINDPSIWSTFINFVAIYCSDYEEVLTEKLILTRNNYSLKYNGLQLAWKNGMWCDISLIAGSKTFPVHKAVICSRSPFFRGLLTSGLRESKMNTITLDIDNPKVMEAILEYMYINEIDFSNDYQDIILDIFVTCNKYQVLGCIEYLEDIISNNIEIENVLSLILLADREKALKLFRCCKEFISSEKHLDFIFYGPEYQELKPQIDLLLGPQFYFEAKRMIEIQKEEEEKQKNA